MSGTTDPIDALIGTADEAVVDLAAWQRLVEAINVHLDGAFVHLHAHDHVARSNVGIASSGHSPEFLKTYLEYYQHLNPLAPQLFNAPIGQAVHTEDLIDRSELQRTEFYNDWFRPQDDCAAGCGMVLLREGGRMFFAGIHLREKDAVRKAAPTRVLLERLRPHLLRTMNLRRSMGPEQIGSEIYRASLDTIAEAVFHLDHHARIIWTNRSARVLSERVARFRSCAGQKIRTGDTALDTHIREICQGRPSVGWPFVIDARSEIGTLLVGQVLPIKQLSNPMGIFERDVCAMLIVHTPGHRKDWQGVTRHFGLTGAETALADALVHGGTLDQYAASRGTSIHTVRNQLRSVLAKTGTNRQSEMVGLLAPFAAPRLPQTGA